MPSCPQKRCNKRPLKFRRAKVAQLLTEQYLYGVAGPILPSTPAVCAERNVCNPGLRGLTPIPEAVDNVISFCLESPFVECITIADGGLGRYFPRDNECSGTGKSSEFEFAPLYFRNRKPIPIVGASIAITFTSDVDTVEGLRRKIVAKDQRCTPQCGNVSFLVGVDLSLLTNIAFIEVNITYGVPCRWFPTRTCVLSKRKPCKRVCRRRCSSSSSSSTSCSSSSSSCSSSSSSCSSSSSDCGQGRCGRGRRNYLPYNPYGAL